MDKKLIALIILGIAAVISLVYGITSSGKSGRVSSSNPAISQKPEGARKALGIAPAKRRAKRTKFASWDRSPFVPEGAPGASSLGINLKGIMWNEKKPKAMIGTSIVGKGDRVGDNTVIEVKRDHVILNDGAKNFELKLKE